MKHFFEKGFAKKLYLLPEQTQKKFWQKLKFLLIDMRHPSLHSKKYDEANNVWQARVDKSYRFYFLIESDRYILLDIRSHPKQ